MTVDIRVLGPLRVVTSGGADVVLGGPQQRMVLAFLALRANDVVPADTLVNALWGEATPRTATNVVSTYVSRLRKLLSTASDARLSSRPRGYVLEIDRDLVDAHRFVRLVERGREAASSGHLDDSLTAFDTALGLWRGAMLADLNRLEALRPEISRLEEMQLSALEDRIDVRLAAGHHVEVVAELDGLTAAHPFRERFWGQLVVALYRSGRQADALAAYQSVRSLLVNQLGVEPGPELRALEHDVLTQVPELRWHAPGLARNGKGHPSSAQPPASPNGSASAAGESVSAGSEGVQIPLPSGLATDHGHPFVGRDRERSWLAACFDEARAGRFATAFLAGTPGIGKTALAGWFSRKVSAEGAVVVHGSADEGAGVPFLPLAEAVRHWATHASPGALRRLDEADAKRLCRLVPEMGGGDGDVRSREAPEPSSPADRQLLFGAIARWVEALAARAPAVILLEDLHWADPGTFLAVQHLLRHPPDAGALLLVTYRHTELEGGHGLNDVLASIRGDRGRRRFTLAGLRDEDVIELLSTRAGGQLAPDGRQFAAQLSQLAGGNPLFIHEMVQHLTERGVIDPAAQQWDGQRPSAAFGVPSAVLEVIEQRLSRLNESTTTTLLRHAAVLGEQFGIALLARCVGMAEIPVIEALEPAVCAGLVAPSRSGAESFMFSHALVREAILDGFPLSQKIRAHWKAGEAIGALSASHPHPPLGEIARHLAAGVHAGDPHAAVAANVLAGQQALMDLAFEDARARFATATELAEATGVSDPELVYDAWMGFGQASGTLGDFAGQRDGFLQAALIARDKQWGERLADAATGLAAAGAGSGDAADQARFSGLVDEALSGLDRTPSASHCWLLGIKTVRTVSLDGGDPQPLAALAAELAQATADPVAQAGALMARAWALLGTPYAQELSDVAESACAVKAPTAIVAVLNFVAPLLPAAALQLGDRERFENLRNRLATDPRTRDAPHIAAYVRTWDAALALSQGRFDAAERLSATISGASDWLFWRIVAKSQANAAARERGQHTRVEQGLARSLVSGLPPHITTPVRAMLAATHAEAGDRASALHQVEVLRRESTLNQLGWGAPFVLRNLAEVAAATGEVGLAADLLEVLTGHSGQILVSFTGVTIEAAADRAIGQVLMALGRLDEAVEHLAAAQALETAFGADALVARTAYWHAQARLERDGPDDEEKARKLLDQASSQARKAGMEALERSARL